MIYERFTLEVWYYHCTDHKEIKNKIRTSFESLAPKKDRTERLLF